MKRLSLINKMQLLNLVGITAAMVVVLVILSVLYSVFSRHTLEENVLADGRLLATNTAPMLVFHDQEEARKLASAFQQTRDVQRIIVFDQQNVPFVDLVTKELNYRPLAIKERLAEIDSDTAIYQDGRLFVFVPVLIESERVGTVVVESSLKSIHRSIMLFVLIATLATIFGILSSAYLLKKMHSWALAPIIDMSRLAEEVAKSKKYNLRAKVIGGDEVASLAKRFNQMLERIELWDKYLTEELDQSRESEKHLDTLARTDELTRLPNRLAFNDDLENGVAEATKGNKALTLLFIDLDDFKQVNDIHGHHSGDIVLKVVARRLISILRDTDRLYRLGGDEFSAILRGMNDDESAFHLCERLIEKVREPINIDRNNDDLTVKIGASVGLASFPAQAASPSELLRCADVAMYAAKRNGKNSFKQFDESMEE